MEWTRIGVSPAAFIVIRRVNGFAYSKDVNVQARKLGRAACGSLDTVPSHRHGRVMELHDDQPDEAAICKRIKECGTAMFSRLSNPLN